MTADDKNSFEETNENSEYEMPTPDEEGPENSGDSCKGGYHPVQIEDVYLNRYYTLRKLGWGYFDCLGVLGFYGQALRCSQGNQKCTSFYQNGLRRN